MGILLWEAAIYFIIENVYPYVGLSRTRVENYKRKQKRKKKKPVTEKYKLFD